MLLIKLITKSKCTFMKTQLKTLGTLSLLFIMFFSSCTKETESAKLDIRLTDAPGQYDNVFIDIQGIEIHSDSGWISPSSFNAGIYDLLELNNGLDTLLCAIDMPVGKISQIRLILGDNNTVVVDSISFPLTTPSAQQSGLKLNVHMDIQPNVSYTILLDFDAAKSIVLTGNGKYILKPLIRAITDQSNGKIKGYVIPTSAQATVYAINASDTVAAIPNNNGYFMICGLNGTYDLLISPANTAFQDTLLSSIQVSWGSITNVDTITLH